MKWTWSQLIQLVQPITNEVEVESTGNDVSNVGDQPVSQESDRPKRNRRPPKWHEDYHIW